MITFLGFVIKHFNIADILNFFDEEKHDKYKASKIVGRDFLAIGISVIIAAVSIFVNEKYYKFIMISQAVIIIVGIIITYYQLFRDCKK